MNRVGTSPGAFAYSYTGNKLTSLKVNTTPYAYTYDANGNATKDGYRGMDLQYNLLNLPRKVSKGTGSVEYVYLASGAKLAKKVNGVFTQFYNGSVVYKGDKTAEYISTSEGLAMKTASGFAYQYNLSDHLGNVRVVLNQDKSVAQSTNYYPFGLAHATSALEKNKYLYNGKEIQSDVIGGTAFGMLDYGARFYDPVIGRWHSIDPLASKYAGLSGYNYVTNNPMKFIDPNGMDVYRYDNESGKMVLTIKNDDKIDQIGRFDYDKKTGEYTVKTNRKGEVKTSIDNIEKGILNDGINFKENNNLIEVGGEGQATVGGVEVFALKLSEFAGNEIGGAYFSKGNSGNTTHMTIGRYKGNDLTTTKSGNGHVAGFKAGLAMNDLTGFFHTHPTINGDQTNRFDASKQDKDSKKNALKNNPNMTFFILTAPRYPGGEHSFPY